MKIYRKLKSDIRVTVLKQSFADQVRKLATTATIYNNNRTVQTP